MVLQIGRENGQWRAVAGSMSGRTDAAADQSARMPISNVWVDPAGPGSPAPSTLRTRQYNTRRGDESSVT